MKKIYMTKKREKALHTAISIDDLLYRKFEIERERIDKYARHLERTYKNVIRVRRLSKEGNFTHGNLYLEKVISVDKVDGEGLIITIE